MPSEFQGERNTMSAEQESQLPKTIAKALMLRRKGQQFTNPGDSVKAVESLVSAHTGKVFATDNPG